MDKTFPSLFARDSKNKILVWKARVGTTGFRVDITKAYGEFGGAMIVRHQNDISGKNLGKINETSPFEQACLQVESEIKTKRDKGYRSYEDLELPNNAPYEEIDLVLPKYREDISGNVKPMKAQQYYRKSKEYIDSSGVAWDDRAYYYFKNPYVDKDPKDIVIKFPCMAQPKINGVRSTISFVEGKTQIKSKEGLTYTIPALLDYCNQNPEIFKQIEPNGSEMPLVLDGELYIHGEPLSTISSAVKKVSLLTQRVIFVLFDLAIPNKTQKERWDILKALKDRLPVSLENSIQLIRAFNCNNDKQAQSITDMFITKGYEGTIFRDYNAMYKFGSRPVTMVKLKRTISEEFTIIDVVAQEKDDTKGNFTCVTENGLTFDVNPKGTDVYKREVLTNKRQYIGKSLTIEFYEWTELGKPLHIISNTVRDYENSN